MSKRKHQVACTENARILRLFEVSCKCPCDTGLAKDAFQNLNLRPSLDVYRSICVTYKKSRNDLIYGVRLFLSHCPCLICEGKVDRCVCDGVAQAIAVIRQHSRVSTFAHSLLGYQFTLSSSFAHPLA